MVVWNPASHTQTTCSLEKLPVDLRSRTTFLITRQYETLNKSVKQGHKRELTPTMMRSFTSLPLSLQVVLWRRVNLSYPTVPNINHTHCWQDRQTLTYKPHNAATLVETDLNIYSRHTCFQRTKASKALEVLHCQTSLRSVSTRPYLSCRHLITSWLLTEDRLQCKICLPAHLSLNGKAPSYISSSIKRVFTLSTRPTVLRSATNLDLFLLRYINHRFTYLLVQG